MTHLIIVWQWLAMNETITKALGYFRTTKLLMKYYNMLFNKTIVPKISGFLSVNDLILIGRLGLPLHRSNIKTGYITYLLDRMPSPA